VALLSRNSSANKSTCLLGALENGKREFEEDMSILIISGIEGVRNCAEAFSKQLEMKVEVAESLAECDPAAADAIWERSGLAIPLQINFAVSGAARIIREIRAALHRREREQAMALEAATASIEKELKNTVSGLLLQSQLALSQGGVPAVVAEKLRMVADLAGTLRQQLSASSPPADISARSANH
jgi:hypothetical protein